MKVLLFGMSGAGGPVLEAIRRTAEPAALVLPAEPTSDDTAWAEASGLPWSAPKDLEGADFLRFLDEHPFDVLLVATYDRKIPASVRARAERGAFNLHPSLLPKYRGHNPYFWVLRNGEVETGVTAHLLTDTFDAGPIVDRAILPIRPGETLGSLYRRLGELSGERAEALLRRLASGEVLEARPQPSADAEPRAPRVLDAHLTISGSMTREDAGRLVRAANPFYGARIYLEDLTLFVWEIAPFETNRSLPPGALRAARGREGRTEILYGLADGPVALSVVEIKGIRIGSGADLVGFLEGR